MASVEPIYARQILDSRCNPDSRGRGNAGRRDAGARGVPSGASRVRLRRSSSETVARNMAARR